MPRRIRHRGVSVNLCAQCIKQAKKQSPLFFRVKLFDPNATLNWLEPKTRFLFSSALAVIAAVTGAIALGIVWVDRGQLVTQFTANFGWQALVVAWFTTIIVTVFHEFGHGLACKRYGGDVHEMGALWIFFTPCFYCNVSDAWLLPSRWKRLLISLAGTYVDFWCGSSRCLSGGFPSLESAVNFAAWVHRVHVWLKSRVQSEPADAVWTAIMHCAICCTRTTCESERALTILGISAGYYGVERNRLRARSTTP